ncbi:MAG TPA: hypothetical protein VFF01_03355 [Candidatus Deferrimicrobiaceae bacterium]|nr:hypothetical protein [Candidatus Deferrimicrobiaceae bacterium]
MKSIHRSLPLAALILWGTLYGCAPANVLTIPRDLAREAAPPAAASGEGAAVAVLDFSWSGPPSGEIGRDYDLVRPIVWKGNPGKSIADLIAAALTEKGIAAVRVAGEAEVPPDVPARVWGSLEEFRVNVKRVGMVKVEEESVATLKVQGVSPGVPEGWIGKVSSSYMDDYPYVTPYVVYDTLNAAANAAADEAVRRLLEAGVVSVLK